MKRYDTVVVGGGPAGMTAALACAGRGRRTLLLDRMERPGKKILVTGNGKCNLTNERQELSCYRTGCPERVREVLSAFPLEKTMEFFRRLGIHTRSKNGGIYPYSEQASAVRDAFLYALSAEPRLEVRAETPVRAVRKEAGDFLVETEAGEGFRAGRVVLASGGLAGVKTGCEGDGYRFAADFGHRILPPLPALTALKSGAPFLKRLSGVRNQAGITLCIDGKTHGEERGELQWTSYGISGVAVFSLSRYAAAALAAGHEVGLLLDFLPELTRPETAALFARMYEDGGRKEALAFLAGFFPAKLCPVILKEAGIGPAESPAGKWSALTEAAKAFLLRISGYVGYEKAQVTSGGVDLLEVTSSLESRLCPGLFFAGELLDVDGTCGGYNLQWAFSSGYVAGTGAAKRDAQTHRSEAGRTESKTDQKGNGDR